MIAGWTVSSASTMCEFSVRALPPYIQSRETRDWLLYACIPQVNQGTAGRRILDRHGNETAIVPEADHDLMPRTQPGQERILGFDPFRLEIGLYIADGKAGYEVWALRRDDEFWTIFAVLWNGTLAQELQHIPALGLAHWQEVAISPGVRKLRYHEGWKGRWDSLFAPIWQQQLLVRSHQS